jgi:hypothetical protein
LFFGLDIIQSSTPNILQTQSQPATMLTSQQQQMVQNSHLLTQPSQSFSYSTTIQPSQHIINNIIPNDTIKQVIHPPPPPPPSSSSSTNTNSTAIETIENSHISISPSSTPLSLPHTSEAVQPSIPSDTQPQVKENQLNKIKIIYFYKSFRYPVVYNNLKFFLCIHLKNQIKQLVQLIVVMVKRQILRHHQYHLLQY